jgi:hypothetical protein
MAKPSLLAGIWRGASGVSVVVVVTWSSCAEPLRLLAECAEEAALLVFSAWGSTPAARHTSANVFGPAVARHAPIFGPVGRFPCPAMEKIWGVKPLGPRNAGTKRRTNVVRVLANLAALCFPLPFCSFWLGILKCSILIGMRAQLPVCSGPLRLGQRPT